MSESKFKVGDVVRILPVDSTRNRYTPGMEQLVGRLKILAADSLPEEGEHEWLLEGYPWWYPESSLQLLKDVDFSKESQKLQDELDLKTFQLKQLDQDHYELLAKHSKLQDEYIELLKLRLEGLRGQNV